MTLFDHFASTLLANLLLRSDASDKTPEYLISRASEFAARMVVERERIAAERPDLFLVGEQRPALALDVPALADLIEGVAGELQARRALPAPVDVTLTTNLIPNGERLT